MLAVNGGTVLKNVVICIPWPLTHVLIVMLLLLAG